MNSFQIILSIICKCHIISASLQYKTVMLRKDSNRSNLPRIYSATRMQTTYTRREAPSQSGTLSVLNKPQGSLRRANSSTKTAKLIRYENSGAVYAGKIQQLQKKNIIIDKEIKALNDEINSLRNQQLNKKRNQDFISDDQVSQFSSVSSMSYRKNLNINDNNTLKNQIKISENKIDVLRKRIDQGNNKNKLFQKQIDGIRKQILTIKALWKPLEYDLQKTNQQYEELKQISKQLDEQIAQKNALMHRKKIQNMHSKAQMIKQYDNILKTLQKQLEHQKLEGNANSIQNFYITQLQNIRESPTQKSSVLGLSGDKKRSVAYYINQAKQRLENYQQQFKLLKQHTGTSNADEITKNFKNKYQQNFQKYKYINELNENLENIYLQNQELIERKQQILKEIEAKKSKCKQKEIMEAQKKLDLVINQKIKCTHKIQEFNTISTQLINTVKLFFTKIDCSDKFSTEDFIENLNEKTLAEALSIIEETKLQLEHFQNGNTNQFRENKPFNGNQTELQQMMDMIKKQTDFAKEQRNQKLMSREDFLKSRQTILNKKRANLKKSTR